MLPDADAPAPVRPPRRRLPPASEHRADRARPDAPAQTAPDVPSWAAGAVWYQIFPERFRNGDASNDPTLASIRGSWPQIAPRGWRVAEWTADWYAQAEWERGLPFYTGVQLRRYGGDLQGVVDALPYLDSLGVTALYLNPVFDAPSLHKYDGATFHHIDVHFGPDPDGDRARIAAEDPLRPETWVWTRADRLFLDLVAEAHRRGMRVVLDGVFNHMGLRSFAYEDLARRGAASPYRDWFTVRRFDDPATPDTNETDAAGWMNVRELPELREDATGLVAPVRDYVFASAARWMDPDGDGDPRDGIDGWRLDVAEMVSLRFWRDFRGHIRAINPDAYLVGEVWWKDWPRDEMFEPAPWVQGDAFDAVMNYRWARAARRFFLASDLAAGQTYDAADFARELDSLRASVPAAASYAMMNAFGTHDTDRLASQVVNAPTRFDHDIGVSDNRRYDVRRPQGAEWALMRRMLAHQFTSVGAPHLFYGDEAGMWGADDPDERKPMVWPEMRFADEASHPFGQPRPRDAVAFDADLFAAYRRLAHLRTSSPALTHGSMTTLVSDARVLVYERRLGEDLVVVAFNEGDDARTVAVPLALSLPEAGHTAPRTFAGQSAADVLGGAAVTLPASGPLALVLPPRSAHIWRFAAR